MADKSKFAGGGRVAPQFGDRISPGLGASADGHCAQCESMLADALDGTLSTTDQALFDAHMAACGPCSEMLADARRGAAWLEMLRDPRPEPPADLLERILAQTSGVVTGAAPAYAADTAPVFAGAPMMPARAVPFRVRFASWLKGGWLGSGMLQPRLAMTAAMAFFSIALTLDLTGVRLTELRAGDLKPSSIKRGFYAANARVVQYYEGLRVVYELESRVHDLESESDSTTNTKQAPAADQNQQQPSQQPPASEQQNDQQKQKKQAPGPGSSRRESPMPSARMVALRADRTILDLWKEARKEGALA